MKRTLTFIALALAMVLLAAVLTGCSTSQAAAEKTVIAHKDAAAPAETGQIVLSLGDGFAPAGDLGTVGSTVRAQAATFA